MKKKIFIDGQEGTTGLKIREKLLVHSGVSLVEIEPELRKDNAERAKMMASADIVILCLPDEAADEAAKMAENAGARVIDASTAHRVSPEWVYGLPELSDYHRKAIGAAKRVANPGCYATGFIVLTAPLVNAGIISKDTQLYCNAVSGYSGGGKKMIAQYESKDRPSQYESTRLYGLTFAHKHLPEMKAFSGLDAAPVFIPSVSDFYNGMLVSLPVAAKCDEAADCMKKHYENSSFISVKNLGDTDGGYLDATSCNGTNNLDIFVFGNNGQTLLCARLDNLGKGASGAAVQNMNIMLGFDETAGLTVE